MHMQDASLAEAISSIEDLEAEVARLEQERGVLQVRNIRTDFDLAHAKATRAILGNKVVDLETQVRGHLFPPALVPASRHSCSHFNPFLDSLYTCSRRVTRLVNVGKLQTLFPHHFSLQFLPHTLVLASRTVFVHPFLLVRQRLVRIGSCRLLYKDISLWFLPYNSVLTPRTSYPIFSSPVPAWLVKVGRCRHVS
jgi:hypothetical protein